MNLFKQSIYSSLFLLLFFYSQNSCAQALIPSETAIDTASAFDFWEGDWKVWWYGKDSVVLEGQNHIEKTLDGKVLQEHFEDPNTGFKGTSISVYNPKKNEWHQAWADNQGGYFNFVGQVADNKRIFHTLPKEVNGKTIVLRMVFYNIQANSFTWDWEQSTDGGETWNLSWRIHYERK